MINYILIPVFVLMVLIWKVLKRTKLVKVTEMDIWTGRRGMEDLDEESDKSSGSSFFSKLQNVVIG